MNRLTAALVTGLAFSSNAFASSSSVTMRIDWFAPAAAPPPGVAGAAPVPTLGTWAIVLLAALLALAVYRLSRKRGLLLKALAPLAAFGLSAAALMLGERTIAGILYPTAGPGECEGTHTYSVAGEMPPPCFINNCGSPVQVSYTVESGFGFDSTPLTDENCTLDYYCDEVGFAGPHALDGTAVPSDGEFRGTAYCLEINPPDAD